MEAHLNKKNLSNVINVFHKQVQLVCKVPLFSMVGLYFKNTHFTIHYIKTFFNHGIQKL